MDFDFNPEFDTDLLGLQYELVAHLSERGFDIYDAYSGVEVDLSGGELRIHLISEFTVKFSEAIRFFAMQNNFKHCSHSQERGYVSIRRRALS